MQADFQICITVPLKKYYGSFEQKTTLKNKITCSLKNVVASLFTFFENVRAICEFRF